MRPPHFYSNMPPRPPYQNFPNQFPNYGYQQPPNPYQSRMMPPGYPGPNPSPRGFDSFMEAANRFISTYQSFQPLIQQATPMLRNLPALWKLYKGFQSVPKPVEDNKGNFNTERREERSFTPPKGQDYIESRQYRNSDYRPNNENKTGASLPRIYQPPYHF